ncbi:MAG: ATP-dependent DNA ligase [Candidatus Altiarchaeota archaeon]|nr:ATP-dependent DNA ligase [Candidatus Altiarchaeota archaeon]
MDYRRLAELFDALEHAPKRLKKTKLISEFLAVTSPASLEPVLLLLQGRVFPLWDKRVLGLSEKLLVKAIGMASGATEAKIVDEWRKVGDIGKVAEALVTRKTQATLLSTPLTVRRVYESLQKVAAAEGHKSTETKLKIVAGLLSDAKGLEARYIARNVLGDLRIGVAEGTLRDAIAWAYLLKEEDVGYDDEKDAITPAGREAYNAVLTQLQAALDRSNDFSATAKTAKEEGLVGLSKTPITPGRPLKCMLAQKVADLEEGFAKVGTPCAIEYKMDGFRMQVHKTMDGEVKLFTRRLEEVSEQFPDVVKAAKSRLRGKEFILDAEAVGYDPQTRKYRPFQDVSQRIRRKYEIKMLEEKLPVELSVFDVLYYEGADFLDRPFEERRAFLAGIVREEPQKVILTPQVVTNDKKEAEAFYKKSLEAGNEGVMLKKLHAPYQPGSRVGTMIKLKPALDTFDLAIVAAEWGTGKRSGWLTSFTVACWDEQAEELVTIGRFGTGIKEKEECKVEEGAITFEEITELLKPLIRKTAGRDVEVDPDVIVEVKFEEVQASSSYSSGYALRFPRFVRLRDDRGLEDMTTLSMVESAYKAQRGRG